MKKVMLLTSLLCFLGLSTRAQVFNLGIKAGANFATLNDVSHVKNKTGFVAGGFLELKFSNIAIQPEVLYSQEGGKFDLGDFDLSYINVPVMLKIFLGPTFNLQIGPQFGFNVQDDLPTLDGIEGQLKAKSFDLSGVAGIGLDINSHLRLMARYHFGLTDAFENGSGKNGVFSLAIGYGFL